MDGDDGDAEIHGDDDGVRSIKKNGDGRNERRNPVLTRMKMRNRRLSSRINYLDLVVYNQRLPLLLLLPLSYNRGDVMIWTTRMKTLMCLELS